MFSAIIDVFRASSGIESLDVFRQIYRLLDEIHDKNKEPPMLKPGTNFDVANMSAEQYLDNVVHLSLDEIGCLMIFSRYLWSEPPTSHY